MDGRLASCQSTYSILPPSPADISRARREEPGKGRDRRRSSTQRVVGKVPVGCVQKEEKSKVKGPGPLLAAARTAAAPFFFCRCCCCCPAFPLCASYLHPQDGKHNTDCAAAAAAA